jgi:hypothetical protein
MKTKVAFSCNWGLSSKECLERYSNQTHGSKGIWNNLEGVENVQDADIIVCYGPLSENGIHTGLRDIKELDYILKNKHKTIIIRKEPDFIEPWNISDTEFLQVTDYKNIQHSECEWWVDLPFDKLIELPYFQKSSKISMISTTKWQHRNKLVLDLDNILGNKLDLFGRGWNSDMNLSLNFKGELPNLAKDPGIYDYEYSVAIENSSQFNYFTEKIVDCMLLWSIPIYWGCPNIQAYFPENSYRLIDLNNPEEIVEILNKPIEDKDINALKEARNLILNKYNVWALVENVIK